MAGCGRYKLMSRPLSSTSQAATLATNPAKKNLDKHRTPSEQAVGSCCASPNPVT